MIHKELFKTRWRKPVCVGTGLVALDVVINGNPKSPPKLWTGGSCGNVLTILSYLGWRSYPLARLRDDVAADELVKDLKKWKVRTSLITRNGSGNTPIVIEKIGIRRSGVPWHRFEWVCPNCGSWFPKYKPVSARDIRQICTRIPQSQVFYFDRIARSSIELAKLSKTKGALIVFEPSGIKDKKLFYECLEVSDIVKFSHERLGHAQELIERINVPLEIETLGAGGLRYCIDGNGRRKWKTMRSYPVVNLKDTAGAGDWCSAGIIHLLGRAGRKGFEKADVKDVDAALSFGQALAALNCYYEGARGSMYSTTKRKFQTLIREIWNGTSPLESIEEKETVRTSKVIKHICPYCIQKDTD